MTHKHVPAIVHRSGGVAASVLNACAVCGCYIVPGSVNPSDWVEVSEAQAERIRAGQVVPENPVLDVLARTYRASLPALFNPLSGVDLQRWFPTFQDLRGAAESLLLACALVCVSPERHERCDNPATAIFWQDQAEFYPCCAEHWPGGEQWTGSTRFPRGGRMGGFLCFDERIGPDVLEVWTKAEKYDRTDAA